MTADPSPVATVPPWHLPTGNLLDLPLFTTRYRVRICDIGEDGDLVMLGHVGTLRALAAVRAKLRADLGPDAVTDASQWQPGTRFTDRVEHCHGVLATGCDNHPDCGQDPELCEPWGRCAEIAESEWWIDTATRPVPGSFPVTYWRA